MNKTNADQTIAMQAMDKTNADQTSAMQAMNKTITDQTIAMRAMNQSLTSLSAVARVEPDVFFTAIFTSGQKTLSANQVLIFDKIVTNVGNGYSSQTGVFTSPIDGYYFVELHIFEDGEHDFFFDLQHNGSKVISVNKNGNSGHGSASGSVTLKLRKNDQLKVVGWGWPSDIYGDSNYLSTIFGGRLISVL